VKLTKYRRNHTIGINMTPMIDIVFLLIIFFMTVSQITRIRDLPVQLPTIEGGTAKNKITNVTINVTENGEMHVTGKQRTEPELVSLLAELLSKYDNNPQRIKIEIRYDRRCKSATMNQLVKRLTELGFTQVMPVVATEQ
jgi:biopolymer transport protein ExbD